MKKYKPIISHILKPYLIYISLTGKKLSRNQAKPIIVKENGNDE